MKVAISTARQAHYRLPANACVRRGAEVTLYTATPRSRMRGFDHAVKNRWIPAPVSIFSAVTHTRTPLGLDELDSIWFDRYAAMSLRNCDFLLGAASSTLATGKTAKRLGATFVLDRACPDIRVQQQMLVEEAHKAGGTFRPNSAWFIERQLAEYEEADYILSPSDYSRRSYPDHLRSKVILAPLFGRFEVAPRPQKAAGSPFILGVVGGHPLRKGYLYLLQAWKELALPNSLLSIRGSDEIHQFPVLKRLITEQSNIRLFRYMHDLREFYRNCDAFILPSIDDGFGMALFEAMANGVPSIVTRNCGASELLQAERDCLIIDAFSVHQIKEAILRMYESSELRDRLEVSGPAVIQSLQQDGHARPYDEGIDQILNAIAGRKSVRIAA